MQKKLLLGSHPMDQIIHHTCVICQLHYISFSHLGGKFRLLFLNYKIASILKMPWSPIYFILNRHIFLVLSSNRPWFAIRLKILYIRAPLRLGFWRPVRTMLAFFLVLFIHFSNRLIVIRYFRAKRDFQFVFFFHFSHRKENLQQFVAYFLSFL